MSILLLFACRGGPTPDDSLVADSSSDSHPLTAPGTVLWFTVDTMNEDWLLDATYDASPNHQRIFDEGVVLENTVVTRGITIESLPSMATGTYRRTHGVHDTVVPDDMPSMIQEYYADAGFRTFGYSSNFCEVIGSRGWERFYCTGPGSMEGGDLERDSLLTERLLADLEEVGEEPLFIWIHVRDPHANHTPRDPWLSEFWGDRPLELGPVSTEDLSQIMLGTSEKPEGFDEWLEAVYASELASDDAMLGEIVAALEESGRWDDTLVVTGTDHGEEMGAHDDYYFHGCSPYDTVMNTTWAIRSPGLSPGVVEDHVSTIDIVPTVLSLSGLSPGPDVEGVDIVPLLRGESQARPPVFFERGEAAAGVVDGTRKYFMQAVDTPFRGCSPYSEAQPYPGPTEGLWELSTDPDELDNLVSSEDPTAEKTLICEWVTEKTWVDAELDDQNRLVAACKAHLGI